MISHDFTIILGVREKNIAYPHRTKKTRTHYAKFSQALGGPKSRTPQFEEYATFFFAYRVRNMQNQNVFRVAIRDFRGTSV